MLFLVVIKWVVVIVGFSLCSQGALQCQLSNGNGIRHVRNLSTYLLRSHQEDAAHPGLSLEQKAS